jgi:hypothetical protein
MVPRHLMFLSGYDLNDRAATGADIGIDPLENTYRLGRDRWQATARHVASFEVRSTFYVLLNCFGTDFFVLAGGAVFVSFARRHHVDTPLDPT